MPDADDSETGTLGELALATTMEERGQPVDADAAPARPVLVRVFAPHSERVRRAPIEEEVTLIGRGVPAGGIVVKDARCSRVHAALVWEDGALRVENRSKKNPARVFGRRVSTRALEDGAVLRCGDTCWVLRFERPNAPEGEVPALLGSSPAARALRHQLSLVARTSASVLLLGETGTGKEVAATAIHGLSGRDGPLVPVNCGAIPEALAESQFFGHKKGAFSGADKDEPGAFQSAAGGTLFLDEVGELPPSLQPKLLRALDTRSVTPVGEHRPRAVDVRVVAATNRRLRDEVDAGAFRADLFARLADMTLALPPLRDRREDVLQLVRAFLANDHPLSADLAEALLCHSWPFNVREARTVAAELAVRGAEADGYALEYVAPRLDELVDGDNELQEGDDAESAAGVASRSAPGREEVVALLEEHGGNVMAVARATGRSRKQVYRWLARYELNAGAFRRA